MSSSPAGIVSAGLWLIDAIKYIDHYPAPSRLGTVSEVILSNGGGAFNVAIDLARLGATFPIRASGLIGDDDFGRWIMDRCALHRVDTVQLRPCPDQATAFTDVMTEAGTGRRTFFHMPGANALFDETQVDFGAAPARIFYLGYPGLLPRLDRRLEDQLALGALLQKARSAGTLVAVDFVSAESAAWPEYRNALPAVDLLFINEWEACRLLGHMPIEDSQVNAESLTQLARAILALGVQKAVIVHAAQGAVCLETDGQLHRLGAVNVPGGSIRGTCGAGDALASGVLFGVHEGMSWPDALELGVCAAATCLLELTSSDGIQPWQECLAYGRKLGYRPF